jgi:peptide-methionine (R)-S-oxide reductase
MDITKITNPLTPAQRNILQDKATEVPYSGEYLYTDKDGTYACAACNHRLFNGTHKFVSHCGWPAFYDVATSDAVRLVEDRSHGMVRTEVVCGHCGGHLGHLFNDAPGQPTGMRYCINSLSLDFTEKEQ